MVRSKLSLRECFAVVNDPRREHQRFHHLWDIIAITICAVIGGADCWPDVEEYGRCKQPWLESFLDLPHGIPSHDTFERVFALLDPLAFQEGFAKWVHTLVEANEGRVVAIDGKTLRHSSTTPKAKARCTWLAPGWPKTTWCWANRSWTASRTKSQQSRNAWRLSMFPARS